MLDCYISLGSIQWLWTSQNLEKPAQTQVRIHNTHTPKPQSEIGAPSPTHTPLHKNQSEFGALPYLNPIRNSGHPPEMPRKHHRPTRYQ